VDEITPKNIPRYSCVHFLETVETMKRTIEELSGLLNVKEDDAYIISRAFHWKREKLLDDFFNQPEKALEKAGVILKEKNEEGEKMVEDNPQSAPSVGICPICYEEVSEEVDFVKLECGHEFCVECFSTYLSTSIEFKGPLALSPSCPQHTCSSAVPDSTIMDYLR